MSLLQWKLYFDKYIIVIMHIIMHIKKSDNSKCDKGFLHLHVFVSYSRKYVKHNFYKILKLNLKVFLMYLPLTFIYPSAIMFKNSIGHIIWHL